MKNLSYYDEVRLVSKSLEYWERYKENDEVLYGQYEALLKSYNECKYLVSNANVDEQSLIDSYKTMCTHYLAAERAVSVFDHIAKESVELRDKVKVLVAAFTDPSNGCLSLSSIKKSGIPPESIKVVGKLATDSYSIGFWLDDKERDAFDIINEYVMNDCGC